MRCSSAVNVSIALASFAFLAACTSDRETALSRSVDSDHGLAHAEIDFTAPLRRGNNEFVAHFSNNEGPGPVTLREAVALMPAHGHVSESGQIEETPEGYRVTSLNLYMSGRWQLELELRLGSDRDYLGFSVDIP